MKKISTKIIFSLAFVLLVLTTVQSAALKWPLKENIDLSSGFGDYRPNRFHAGVDLRTNGKVGLKIFSPVNGYLYRIKMSYDGYGKGLYIKGKDGNIYVYGHLSNFCDKIDKIVKLAQIEAKRYYLDITFPKDSIEITKDEFIGYTGKTGSGQPHLHFEQRSKDNFPLNPLKNDFQLTDNIKPVFEHITFKQIDNYSLFDNGLREMIFEVQPIDRAGNYKLNNILYLNRPFGILTNVYDKMRQGGMKQSVYKLSLFYDDKLYYEVVFDKIDFETQRSVNLVYDYPKAVDKMKNFRRLFHRIGNDYTGTRSKNKSEGFFGENHKEKLGLHEGKIIAEDCSGNKATLEFKFLWGPHDNIYNLDSTTVKNKTTNFFFTPIKEYKNLSIDSVQLFLNKNSKWGLVTNYEKANLDNGKLKITVPTGNVSRYVFSLVLFSGKKIIKDNLFNGILKKGKQNFSLKYEILDDGLLLEIKVISKFASESRLEFYYKDSLLGIEYPQFFNMDKYLCYIPPSAKYARIDKIGYDMMKDSSRKPKFLDSLKIYVVGLEDNQIIDADSNFSLHFNKDNFFQPRFIEVKSSRIRNRTKLNLNSDLLKIFPESFVCKNDFEISVKLKPDKISNQQSGLCWLDEKENRWIWLENEFENDVLKAKSTGGGSLAAIFDYDAPKVLMLNIEDQKDYYDPYQEITFILHDSLSGIKDNQSILVRVDSKWLIPEYEPESGEFITRPNEPLSPGKHHLGIMIYDQAGNLFEQYLNFYIKEKPIRNRKH